MAKAEISDDGTVIDVDVLGIQKDIIKRVPGCRWNTQRRTWTVPLTWPACIQLRGEFGDDLIIGSRLTEWSWREFNTRVRPITDVRQRIDRVPGDWDERLYDFQTAGATFLQLSGSGLLADDMGMGKTAQIIATLNALMRNDDEVLPALVICPNSVLGGWFDQIKLWKLDVNPYVLTGGAVQRRKMLAVAKDDPKAVIIMNIEAVRQFSRLAPYGSINLRKCRECVPKHGEELVTARTCEIHPKELNAIDLRTVILDEAHRIKDPRSKQTRACWYVGHQPSVRQRWAMTGTPISNHVGDLWSILHFITPSEHPTRSAYIDRYALQAWNAYGGMDIVGVNPVAKNEFYRVIDTRFRRIQKSLVLTQLPSVVRVTRYVSMIPKQEKAYRDLEKQMVAYLDNGDIIVSANNLVNATRLLQLSSSYATTEWRRAPLHVTHDCPCYSIGLDEHAPECPRGNRLVLTLAEPSPKLDAMEEAYDELGGKPVVIVAMSRQLIDLAAKRFEARKIPYVMITGPVSKYDREVARRKFMNGDVDVMLMTISAGGTGLDGLQRADTLFCLQRSWSMIHNVQVDARVHRIGSEQHSSVTIVEFVTHDTIEETTLYPRLAEKYERLEEINRDRMRLHAAGLSLDDQFSLDQREAEIMGANLGIPTTTNVTAEWDNEDEW